jgi:hypothetical protein
MIEWLTIDARLACDHGGSVSNKPSQKLVRIAKKVVLVATDPEGRSISGCPSTNPMMGLRPCLTTLKVQTGYSDFIRIDGHAVCLKTVQGLTDGTPPGLVNYKVLTPGQNLVVAGS